MAGEFHSTDPGLHILITSVAKSIAIALNSRLEVHYLSCKTTSGSKLPYTDITRRASPCFCGIGVKLRALKRDFATIHDEEHLIGRCFINSSARDRREMQRRLDEIALCLDSIIDGEYVGKFCPRHYIEDMRVKQLYHALQERPTGFEDSRVLRNNIVDECSRLLSSLTWISNWVNDAALSDLDFYPIVSVPPVPSRLYQGSESVRDLTTRLHGSLHQGWPCQTEHDGEHEGKLGECTRANMRLDPKWLRHGAEDKAFFVILAANETTYQECEIHLDMSRSVDHDGLLCLVEYEHSVDYCLYLITDATNRLRDDDDERLDLQLLASDLPRSHRYELTNLREILPNLRMDYPRRRDLQLRLARTVLPLLAGPWMENNQAVYDISILCTVHENQYYPKLDNLFLSSRFGTSAETSQIPRYGHPFPAIESLGILMAEIELSGQISKEPSKLSSSQTARGLLAQCKVSLPETGGVLRAISFCIDPNSFKGFRPRKGETGLKEADKFSSLFYESIIRPLEKDLVDGCMWTWDEASWESPKAIDDPTKANPNKLRGTKGLNRVQEHSTKRVFSLHTIVEEMKIHGTQERIDTGSYESDLRTVHDARGGLAGNGLSLETDAWFERLEEMRMKLDCARKEIAKSEIKRLIRVAVLDTGVNMKHAVFERWRKTGQLDPGLDLIDEHSAMTDTDGHGTHVCHVLLKTAPNIKLYPIRILKERQANALSPSLVAKGIHHAIQAWDVDVVSMSFAFDENQPEIEDAIRAGSHKQVLFFAAASNNSTLKKTPISFPGRMTDSVICVFSSTINGQRSDFSPRGSLYQPNFSVIGENIEAAWVPSQDNQNRLYTMSGTSCATPIVAGIAALLLDFAKQYKKTLQRTDEDIRRLTDWETTERYLQSLTGMKSVLRRCMTDEEHMSGNYHFLKPWQLLEFDDSNEIATRIQIAIEKDLGTAWKASR